MDITLVSATSVVLGSLVGGSTTVATTVRPHWSIENQQHWVLDVQWGEDACQARKDHSAENLAVVRRMALNVLHHNGPARESIRHRKLRCRPQR